MSLFRLHSCVSHTRSITREYTKLCSVYFNHTRRLSLDSGDVRVRFAPSPTGMLHLGGLRTALYNYLFARSRKGTFILRIEDTDQTRVVPGAIQKLQDMLEWTGIEIDEGPTVDGNYGPYIQSQRMNIYQDNIKPLLESGDAYRCFCTPKRLELLRKEALRMREVPKYGNRCRHLTEEQIQEKMGQGQPFVIRLKLQTFEESWTDMILGEIRHDVASIEGDPILIKTDNFPTYHFANVVDDHLMGITHVMRGMEWQTSTTKHMLLYKAFGWKPPCFMHLPLILNKDGTKLSKRQGDIHVEHFKKQGYFPEVIINFITSMGGGFNLKNTDGLSMGELIKNFDVNRINANPSKLNMEKSLDINRSHIRQRFNDKSSRRELIQSVRNIIKTKYLDEMISPQVKEDAYIEAALDMAKDRIFFLEDLTGLEFEFLWILPPELEMNKIGNVGADIHEVLDKIVKEIKSYPEDIFSVDSLAPRLKHFAKAEKYKYGSFMKLLRGSLSGLGDGPPVAEMMSILGKENSLSRLQHSLSKIKVS